MSTSVNYKTTASLIVEGTVPFRIRYVTGKDEICFFQGTASMTLDSAQLLELQRHSPQILKDISESKDAIPRSDSSLY